jgi:hypothetical protein
MRVTSWALVIFQCLFLNVFVPLHTRGAISLDGKSRGGTASCCSKPDPGSKHEKNSPTPEDRRSCAVCYLVSAYVPVDPVILEHELRECVRLAHDAAAAQVRNVDYHIPFWAAGPPVTGWGL